jgi:hypothetical protein
MDEKRWNRITRIIAAGLASFILAYFLTNLHRSVGANVYVYTYNTVTGKMTRVCYGVNCSEP